MSEPDPLPPAPPAEQIVVAPRKHPPHLWKKGQSGNLRGNPESLSGTKMVQYRRRMSMAVRKQLPHTEIQKTLKVLMEIRDDPDANRMERITACREILDRSLGKAKVEAEITVNNNFDLTTRINMARQAAGLISEIAQQLDDNEQVIDAVIEEPKALPQGSSDDAHQAGDGQEGDASLAG